MKREIKKLRRMYQMKQFKRLTREVMMLAFYTACIILLAWILVSFANINAHNGIGDDHRYWKYNFFTMDWLFQ